MEQSINIAEELDKLETTIGSIIVGSAQKEAEELKKEIRNLVQKVEETLTSQAKLSRKEARMLVDNLQQHLNLRLGQNLAKAREKEYYETKSNFSAVRKAEYQDVSDGLMRFQCEGIASKNNEYCDIVEQVSNEVISAYEKMLSKIGTRLAVDAYMDIKHGVRRTSSKVKDIHEEYTASIKQGVVRKVSELGVKITESLDKKIEQKVEEKVQTELTDFEKTMQQGKYSHDEQAANDANQMSKNEAAFRGSEATKPSTRKDLEAQFK